MEKVSEQPLETASASILNSCRIVNVFGAALQHFGYVNLEPDLTFSDLVGRWTKRTKARGDGPTEWINELIAEIYRALENSPGKSRMEIIRERSISRCSLLSSCKSCKSIT